MTNLAIECSGTAGSVALFDQSTPIDYVELSTEVGSVQSLAVAIKRVVQRSSHPSFISVTNGPGSFTGLRVGLATAKMLGMAWNIPIVPVDTLAAIGLRAAEELRSDEVLISCINAFRGQLFAAAFKKSTQASPHVLVRSRVVDAPAWLNDPRLALQDGLNGLDSVPPSALLTGPGLKTYPLPTETANRTEGYRTAPEELWSPTAREVAILGQVGFERGEGRDAMHLDPNYIRASAAEEKAKRP